MFDQSSAVRLASFNSCGDLAVTATRDGNVQLWSVESGSKTGEVLAHPGNVYVAVFMPDDKLLVTASADERVRVWKVREASLHAEIVVGESGSAINCLALSPDGSRGVASAGDSPARVESNYGSNRIRSRLPSADTCRGILGRLGSDRNRLADGHALLWNATNGRLVRKLPHASAVKQVAFTSNSKRVVTRTDEGAFIWSLETNPPESIAIKREGVKETAIDPSGSVLLTVESDHTVRRWNLRDGKPLGSPLFHANNINGAGTVLTRRIVGAYIFR